MKYVYLYSILAVCFFVSCHSSKKMVNVSGEKQMEMLALYDSVTKNYGDYSTVSLKFSVDSKELKSLPVQLKGSLRIKRDSAIWISVMPTLNIEVLRCIITQDSVKFYSKLQHTQYATDLQSLSQQIGVEVDYATVQSVLLDELFISQQGKIDTLDLFKSMEINKKEKKVIFQTHSKKEFKKVDTVSLLQIWQISMENLRISQVEILEENADVFDSDKMKFKLNYDDFETFGNISFPTKLSLKAKMPSKKIHFEMMYSKILFNEDLSFPFNPSDKYQKMELKN